MRGHGRDLNLQVPTRLALFFLIGLALTRLGPIWPFKKNLWQAMLLEAGWALLFIWAARSVAKSGLTLRISTRAWRASMITTGVLLLFVVFRKMEIKFAGLVYSEDSPLVFLLFIYLMIMPGIAEYLSYRVVIHPRLNDVFGRPWKLLGAQVGWGWILTSVIFWAPHAFRVDPQLRLSFHWQTLTMQLIAGAVFGWLRERTGSVFPAMVAHNLTNVVWTLM